MINKKIKTNRLVEFILDEMGFCDLEEFNLTVFFLTALIFEENNQFMIYMNELLNGIDLHPDEFHRVNTFRGINLSEEQILKAVEKINKKDLLNVERIDGSNYQFIISYK